MTRRRRDELVRVLEPKVNAVDHYYGLRIESRKEIIQNERGEARAVRNASLLAHKHLSYHPPRQQQERRRNETVVELSAPFCLLTGSFTNTGERVLPQIREERVIPPRVLSLEYHIIYCCCGN